MKRDFPEDRPVFDILVGDNNITIRYQKIITNMKV